MPVSEPAALLHRHEGVATITLNRPTAGNALNAALIAALGEAVATVADDPSIGCVVLTGAGKLFCGGGDIPAMAAAQDDPAAYLANLAQALHQLVRTLVRMPKPLVVLVNGPAAGAGVSLAILGDVVLAARNAHFTAGYGSVGLSPDGGMSWLLPRLIGFRPAQEFILTNCRIDAAKAAAVGLITRAVDDADLQAEGLKAAKALAQGPVAAIDMARALLWQGLDSNFDDHLDAEARNIAHAASMPDFSEGISAFKDRRRPVFGKNR